MADGFNIYDYLRGVADSGRQEEMSAASPAMSQQRQLLQQLSQFLTPILRQQMGQAQAEQDSPFLMFPNRGVFARHPGVFGAIERGLAGAALTKQGETAGENISNVAAAVLGVPEFMEERKQQRMLRPLQTAGPLMETLQASQKLDMQEFDRQLKLAEFFGDREYKAGLLKWYEAQIAASQQPRFSGTPFIDSEGRVWDRDTRSGNWKLQTDAQGRPLQGPRQKWDPGFKNFTGSREERAAFRDMQAAAERGEIWDEATFNRRVTYYTGQFAGSSAAGGAGGRVGAGVDTPDVKARDIQRRTERLKRDIARADKEAQMDYFDWNELNRGAQPPEGKTKRDLWLAARQAAQQRVQQLEAELEALEGPTAVPPASQTAMPTRPAPRQQAAPRQAPPAVKGKPTTAEELKRKLGIK